ncbi:TPA: hypothetical protein OKE00_004823 [Escherichia coli]|nr:hypothetical protein [Escherichia coli]
MTKPVSISNKPRKQHTPEFRNEALKLAERIGVAAAAREPRQPDGCKLKTAPVRPVVARSAEYVCSEDLFY